ncbi:MAG TPA: hypothetical protein VHE81_11620 [Lacipirellulaceae bacterium]|nr:hypothetical protein [Lacipirellulaceae bacterium]
MPTPTTDFSVFDWQELVTYAPVADTAVNDVLALRRPLTQSGMRNVERFIQLRFNDVVFHLDGTNLVAKVLGAGDVVTDANSVTYQVLVYERQMLNNTVAVVCRRS